MKRLPRLLAIFLAIITAVSALSYAATWAQVHIRHKTGFPYTATFLDPEHQSLDLVCFQDRFQFFHTDQFFGVFPQPFNYPPPVAIVYRAVYAAGVHAYVCFIVPMLLALMVAAAMFCRALIRRGLRPRSAIAFTAISLILSYPFAIAFYLGNVEIVVWALLTLGIYLFLKGYGWQAAILFGVAGSMKYFPLIYLALPLAQRRYRDALLVPIVGAASIVGSAWFVGPTISAVFHGLRLQTHLFSLYYLNAFHELESSIDHSLFGLIKLCFYDSHHLDQVPHALKFFLAVVAPVGALLWFVRIRKLPVTNQVLALSTASILLPPISHDYTLMHLYAPWAMLVLLALSARLRGMGIAFTCFALLFTPQSFLIVNGVRYAGEFKALVLLLLFVVALRFPFADSAAVSNDASSGALREQPFPADWSYRG